MSIKMSIQNRDISVSVSVSVRDVQSPASGCRVRWVRVKTLNTP